MCAVVSHFNKRVAREQMPHLPADDTFRPIGTGVVDSQEEISAKTHPRLRHHLIQRDYLDALQAGFQVAVTITAGGYQFACAGG